MTDFTFISPDEAHQRSVDNLSRILNHVLLKIDNRIRAEADSGNFQFLFDLRQEKLGSNHATVVTELKETLIDKGYTVKVKSQFQAATEVFEILDISWEEGSTIEPEEPEET